MPSLPLPTRPRVLIADDHAEMLERTRAVLAVHFDVVAAVADGQAAIDAAARLAPDVVVLDISMPVLNGFDAARQILSGDRQPRVVFLSVHEDGESRDMAERLGASAYVIKRHVATHLVAAIHGALIARTAG